MLNVTIPEIELFNEETNEFTTIKAYALELEHSLISLSRWESKWQVPFLSEKEKTVEQTLDYIQCMTITRNIPPEVFQNIPRSVQDEINGYISSPMTATTFGRLPGGVGRPEVITSELIYYWMVALNIPFECQKWHLNRLLTFIKVCNLKNSPPQKMGRKEMLEQRRALNEARKRDLGTRG